MSYEKYIEQYRAYIKKWREVKARNENGDFSHGAAIYGPSCDCVIVFDNDEQKAAYKTTYGF